MSMRRKLLATLACVVLLVQLTVPVMAAGTVYFTAVNKNVLELSDATMPFWSGGYLYVPSTIFSGVNRDLGVGVATISGEEGPALLLYGGDAEFQTLSFDLSKDYAVDKDGNMYFQKAIQRGGVTFLPISLVARCFGLLYTVIEVPRGYLVWVRTKDVDLSERIFADAASYQMESRYSQYLKDQESGSQPSGGEDTTTESPDAQSTSGQQVYLCIKASEASVVTALLDVLDQYDRQVTFYCTVDFLQQQGDLLRRMTASGYTIGIVADAAEGDRTVAEQLAVRPGWPGWRMSLIRLPPTWRPWDTAACGQIWTAQPIYWRTVPRPMCCWTGWRTGSGMCPCGWGMASRPPGCGPFWRASRVPGTGAWP